MGFRKSVHPIIFNKFCWTILAIYPLINSCASKQLDPIEIIQKPILPKEFTYFPDDIQSPNLIPLSSSDEIVNDKNFGRNDPFLPPQISGDQLSAPDTFKFHGLISSQYGVDAFVSYKNRTGTLKSGDVGGENTNLLPSGWALANVDKDTNVLVLVFEKSSIEIDLFSK